MPHVHAQTQWLPFNSVKYATAVCAVVFELLSNMNKRDAARGAQD